MNKQICKSTPKVNGKMKKLVLLVTRKQKSRGVIILLENSKISRFHGSLVRS